MHLPASKFGYQLNVPLNVKVEKSSRCRIALSLGLNMQACGKMFASVGMYGNVVYLVRELGAASVLCLPPEGRFECGFLNQLGSPTEEVLDIVPARSTSEVGNRLLHNKPKVYPEIIGPAFFKLELKLGQVGT